MTAALLLFQYLGGGFFDPAVMHDRLMFLIFLVAVGLAAFCLPALFFGLARRSDL